MYITLHIRHIFREWNDSLYRIIHWILRKKCLAEYFYCFVTHLCKYNLVIQGLSKDQESVKSYCETWSSWYNHVPACSHLRSKRLHQLMAKIAWLIVIINLIYYSVVVFLFLVNLQFYVLYLWAMFLRIYESQSDNQNCCLQSMIPYLGLNICRNRMDQQFHFRHFYDDFNQNESKVVKGQNI